MKCAAARQRAADSYRSQQEKRRQLMPDEVGILALIQDAMKDAVPRERILLPLKQLEQRQAQVIAWQAMMPEEMYASGTWTIDTMRRIISESDSGTDGFRMNIQTEREQWYLFVRFNGVPLGWFTEAVDVPNPNGGRPVRPSLKDVSEDGTIIAPFLYDESMDGWRRAYL